MCTTMMKFLQFLAIPLLVCAEDIVNTNVASYMAIGSHLIKVVNKITVINNGTLPVKSYIYIEDPKNSVIDVSDQFDNKLRYQQSNGRNGNQTYSAYSISLRDALIPKETFMIICTIVLVARMKPVKETITIDEPCLVKVETNLHLYSKYFTLSYRCYVQFDNSITDVYSEYESVERKDNMIVFNFSNLEPFSIQSNVFIFTYKKPINVVRSLERQIQVSMYGKIHVRDNVVLENAASRVTGHYTDVLSLNGQEPFFYAFLPTSAENVEYFDVLGNNSQSILVTSEDDVTFKRKARYPLLGGWKYTYTMQYYVPIHEYMYTDHNGAFYLQMRAIDHVVGNTYIENAVTRVVLPEFARVLKVNIFNKFSRRKDEVTCSCLSMSGNPTVVFNGSYLLDDELYPFMIKFSYNSFFTFAHVITIILIIQSGFTLYLVWAKLF